MIDVIPYTKKPLERRGRKMQHNFRLGPEAMEVLDLLATLTGRTKTELVEIGLFKLRDEYLARVRDALADAGVTS